MTTRTPDWAAFDAGFDAASKAFTAGSLGCARQAAFALAELAAERERMRRWKARLRWRAKNGGPYWREEAEDRLLQRADMSDAKRRERDERPLYLYPIAGPKPGRFLP